MSHAAEQWRLLRTKTDETADDTDWVGTNSTTGLAAAQARVPEGAGFGGRSYTGIECFVAAVADGTQTLQNRSTGVVDIALVETVSRSVPQLGGNVTATDVNIDTAVEAAVPLQRKVYFPFNGGTFTIRITNDATLPASSDLQIWYRMVSR